MGLLRGLSRAIDGFAEFTGRTVAWLTVLLIVNTCAVVIWRYFLGGGSIALQESMTYIHGALFMLAIAYTLKRGGHVRVDVFYRNFSPRQQATVDVFGTLLFLIPVSVLLFVISWDYVINSWAIREASMEGSGLKIVYLLKTLLLILPVTLLLQGLSELLKNSLFLLGKSEVRSEDKKELV